MLIVNRNLPNVPSSFRGDPEIWLFMNAMRDRVGGTTGNLIYDAAATAAYVATTEPQLFAIKSELENYITSLIPSITNTVLETVDASLQALATNQQGATDTINLVLEQVSQQGQDFAALMNMPSANLSGTLDEVLKNGNISAEPATTGNFTISTVLEPTLTITNSFIPQSWKLFYESDYAEPYFGIFDVTGNDYRIAFSTDANNGVVKIGRNPLTAPDPFLKYNTDQLQVFGNMTVANDANVTLRFRNDTNAQDTALSYNATATQFGIYDFTASAWRLAVKDTTGSVLIKTSTDDGTSALQVNGVISGNNNIRSKAVANPNFVLANDTNAQEYRFAYNAAGTVGGIFDATGAAWRLAVKDTTGNVLIKTTTDNGVDALQINGTCSSSGGFSGIGTNLTALNASNIASGTLANARLPNSGVGAGSYTYASITVDAKGIVTAASSGAAPSTTTLTAGAGIAVGSFPNYTVTNTGVTSVIAGAGISVSSATGDVTITNTSPSDYRLKTNFQQLNNATDRLMQLKPIRFAFKSTPEKIQDGFIAHEVQEVVPEAVLGEKDGPEIQTLGMQMLVPLLVKALQEANDRIAALEARLEK